MNYQNPPRSKFLTPIAATLLTYSVVGSLFYLATFVLFKAVHVYVFGRDAQTSGDVVRDSFPIALLLAGLTVGVRIPRLTRQWSWRVFSVVAFVGSAVAYYFIRGGHWRLIVAASVVFLVMHAVYLFRFRFLPSDTRTLVLTGMIAAAASIGTYVVQYDEPDQGPLWPVFLAAAAFFYLWWLAGLLFDLSFIWHKYIRNSRVMTCLREI